MDSETTVIYNASCPVCAREIAHYRTHYDADGLPIRYADIGDPDVTA